MTSEQMYQIIIEMDDVKTVVNIPMTLAYFLRDVVTDKWAWQQLLRSGAQAVLPIVDPLLQTDYARSVTDQDTRRGPLDQAMPQDQHIPATRIRLSPHLDPLDVGLEDAILRIRQRLDSLEDAAKVKSLTEAMAAPLTDAQHQHSANIRRLTNAYQVMAGKPIRVKLSCEGRVPANEESIYLDLPSETP